MKLIIATLLFLACGVDSCPGLPPSRGAPALPDLAEVCEAQCNEPSGLALCAHYCQVEDGSSWLCGVYDPPCEGEDLIEDMVRRANAQDEECDP